MRGGPNRYLYVRARPTHFIDPRGLDTEVIVWDPVSDIDEPGSLAGHVSVRVNEWSYSWESGGVKPKRLWTEYRNTQQYRSGTGYVLPSTPEQDRRVVEFMQKSTGWYQSNAWVVLNVYNLLSRNCAQVAGIGLNAAGLIPPVPILFPSDLHRVLRAKAQSVNHYDQTAFGMTITQWIGMSIQDSFAIAASIAF